MKADINNEYVEICHLIDENQVISFDIYDTALLRNVLYPTDIFDIVQIELEKTDISIANFKKLRIQAEKIARSRSQKEDILIHDIYDVISEKIGAEKSVQIKAIELRLESEFTIQNAFIKRIYDYAKSKGKVVLFISDMYLDEAFINDLLRKNGFGSHNGIYVSGSTGVSKASSNMYKYVRKAKDIKESWLHIGDNRVSDYENAIRSGLHAYYYKALRDRVSLRSHYSIPYSIMKAIQINYSETTDGLSYWHRFGVNVVSSLFFGFTNWLVKELKGKDNVYFLSRDGYLPWKLFEKFAERIDGLPRARYLYASRKMYQLPNITNMDQDEAINLLIYANANLGQVKHVHEIFHDIGLDVSKYKELIEKSGLNENLKIVTNDDRDKLKRIIEMIYSDVLLALNRSKKMLEKYFEQNDLYGQSEINIVDVGWRGSTHKAIKDITRLDTKGFYFGTSYNVYDDIKTDVRSFAFHLGKPINIMHKVMENVMMFEFIFSAPHGSLIGFEQEADNIIPKFSRDNAKLAQIIEMIQSGVLRIADEYLKQLKYLQEINSLDCIQDYLDFIDQKQYQDLLQFKDISLSVGFGENSMPLKFVTSYSIKEFLENRKRITRLGSQNLWKHALIIEGSAEEFRKSKKKLMKMPFFITKERIFKAMKNPKKAIKYLKRMARLDS